MKRYERKYKYNEAEDETAKAKKAIKGVIENNWGGSNEEQYRNVNLMLGLAGNDSDSANKFLKAVNDFTSKLDPEDF